MTDCERAPKKSQKTGKGHEIPIPRRGDFIRDLEKAAEKPPKKSRRGKRRKKD